ncbi:MAG: hypothetical protein ACI9ZF_003567 [Bradyrhizobium sp.]
MTDWFSALHEISASERLAGQVDLAIPLRDIVKKSKWRAMARIPIHSPIQSIDHNKCASSDSRACAASTSIYADSATSAASTAMRRLVSASVSEA